MVRHEKAVTFTWTEKDYTNARESRGLGVTG